MRMEVRGILDKGFTVISGASIVLMTAALVVILGPMIYRGAGAVVFRGTVEWRKLQLNEKKMFGRGDQQEVEAEVRRTNEARQQVYDIIDRFSRGIDVNSLDEEARHVYRELKRQLANRVDAGQMTEQQEKNLKDEAYILRTQLESAYESSSNEEAKDYLGRILNYKNPQQFRGTIGERLFQLAREYKSVVDTVELEDRGRYADELTEVKDILYGLFGPRPGQEPRAPIMQMRYGATRLDQARKLRHRLIMKEVWKPGPTPSSPRVKDEEPRRKVFDGRLDKLFDIMENDAKFDAMFEPRLTVYWHYFIDDSTPGHYFGGVGPEIYGTMMISLLTMVFAVPVGVTAAAYLVECAKESIFVRFIRLCVNTLAGVPSIVFGLFGLALFLGWLPVTWAQYRSYVQPIIGVGIWVAGVALAGGAMVGLARTPGKAGQGPREVRDVLMEQAVFLASALVGALLLSRVILRGMGGSYGPGALGVVVIGFVIATAVTWERRNLLSLAVKGLTVGLVSRQAFLLGLSVYRNPIALSTESNILAGSLTLAVLVLPIIIRASEEAIRSVPRSYKEASMGLGAGGFRTFMTVTLPAALPGVLTGVILSLSRAAGETAPILFTAAVAVGPMPSSVLKGGTRTLSYGGFDLAMNDRLAQEVPHNQYGMVTTLIVLVLILNIAAILIRSRVSRKLRGG